MAMTWEEPPTSDRRPPDKERIKREVARLKRNPGRWAKVRTKAASGNYVTYKRHGLITRTKGVGDGKYDIWAMYDPESPEAIAFDKKQAAKAKD